MAMYQGMTANNIDRFDFCPKDMRTATMLQQTYVHVSYILHVIRRCVIYVQQLHMCCTLIIYHSSLGLDLQLDPQLVVGVVYQVFQCHHKKAVSE